MSTYQYQSDFNLHVNRKNLTDVIDLIKTDTDSLDITSQATIIDHDCGCEWINCSCNMYNCRCDNDEYDYIKCNCISCDCDCRSISNLKRTGHVECLDFAKLVKLITGGGYISSNSLYEMYSDVVYDIGNEDFERRQEEQGQKVVKAPYIWDFTNRTVLMPGSFVQSDKQNPEVKGYAFSLNELPYIKHIIIKFLCEGHPHIVFLN
ncbi:hypothetical protein QJ854_gp938 [Moumouvirus goulette]|uniref:Uncharacterized protein n=1 Tax=Moumouvirus goulette TaxID=1247379 RepID=M1PAF3_9VIRU|nr:hypothetical protein QJ854_gp938 [Moumouvirus goulette]AGF84844.1 hypothetical protein glt_00035 [Moumouvirus goulette]